MTVRFKNKYNDNIKKEAGRQFGIKEVGNEKNGYKDDKISRDVVTNKEKETKYKIDNKIRSRR